MFSHSIELSKVYQKNKILITGNLEKIGYADFNLSETEKLLESLEVPPTSFSICSTELLKWDGNNIFLSKEISSMKVSICHYKIRVRINDLLPDFLQHCLNQIEKI